MLFFAVPFFLYLVAVFLLVGLPFRWALVKLGLRQSFTAISCLGLAAISIVITVGYKIGFSVTVLAWLVNMVAFLSLVFATPGLIRQKVRIDWSLGMRVVAAGLMLAPALVGGLRFTIFQGNHYDSYNYLECALTYQRIPYQAAISSSVQQLLDAGLFPIARDALAARPAVCLLYGTLVAPFFGQGLLVHYGFLVYFQFLSFCVLSLLAGELIPAKPYLTQLLSLAIVGGFWGQYIVDINAWSQAAAMPLLLEGVLLLTKSFARLDTSGQRFLTWTEISAFASACVGAFYLYPEGAIFFFPAYAMVLLFAVYRWRPAVPILPCAAVLACGVALVLLVRENNLTFLMSQVNFALRSGVNWWLFFQAFFFGNGGIEKESFTNLVDVLVGIFGCYLITPANDYHGWIVLLYRLFLLVAFLVLFAGSILGYRSLARPARTIVFSVVIVLTCEAFLFLIAGQYWTAGKTLSYFAYLLLLIVLTPALSVNFSRGGLRAAASVVAGLMVVGQVAFAGYRPLAASLPYGIHYSRPYPAIQHEDLKKDIDFSDLNFLKKIQKQDRVIVQISDPWIQIFVRLLLLSKNIDFCVSSPVFVTAEPLNSASTQSCLNGTCRLVLVPASKYGYRQEVGVEKL
jgi:hypothetical protein